MRALARIRTKSTTPGKGLGEYKSGCTGVDVHDGDSRKVDSL